MQLHQLQVNASTLGCCLQSFVVPLALRVSGLSMVSSIQPFAKPVLPVDCLRTMVNGVFASQKQLSFKLDQHFADSSPPSSSTAILLSLKPSGMNFVPVSVM